MHIEIINCTNLNPAGIRLISDLHFDRNYGAKISDYDTIFPPLEKDKNTVLCIGGDVGSYRYWISEEFKELVLKLKEQFLFIIFIRGNNECFYDVPDRSADFLKSNLDNLLVEYKKILKSLSSNVLIIENQIVEFKNCMMFGAPLFSNYWNRNLSEIESLEVGDNVGPTSKRLYQENQISTQYLFGK